MEAELKTLLYVHEFPRTTGKVLYLNYRRCHEHKSMHKQQRMVKPLTFCVLRFLDSQDDLE